MQQAARWLSIIGHPFVTVTVMVMARGAMTGGAAGLASAGGMFVLIVVVPILILMIRQVRRGAWEHVDATHRRERPILYAVGIAAVLVWFAWLAVSDRGSSLLRGLVVTMVMLVFCAILTQWVKVSLHVTFAALSATSLLFVRSPAGWVIAALVPLVMWSRLRLRRHTALEVALGLVIGVVTGAALHLF